MKKDITLEDLGFIEEKTPYENCILYETKETYYNREIKFWVKDKIIYTNLNYGGFQMQGSMPLNLEIMQAIYNKCKELGWLDE